MIALSVKHALGLEEVVDVEETEKVEVDVAAIHSHPGPIRGLSEGQRKLQTLGVREGVGPFLKVDVV